MEREARRIIFHVDLDAFYVSVEARENPALRGLPTVVGADPEQGMGRGVVITCSYEARRHGLRSGMPISRAWRLCPTAVYIRPNFELYERVSEQVMGTLRGFGDSFEQTGIDEAFLDVSGRVSDEAEAVQLALVIKRTVREVHGLSSSVGIGPNKSSAKIASDRQKPDGLTVVPLDSPAEFLAPLPVSVIPGIGKKSEAFLRARGVKTIAQLQAVPGKELMAWFGKTGVWLWGVAHSQERIPVRAREMPKSLAVERTFREDVGEFERVYSEAESAAHELASRIARAGVRFRVAGVKIRFSHFETHTRERTLPSYTVSEAALWETARDLLREFEQRGEPVRLVGVRVSGLERDPSRAETLEP
ncbi:MAG: DNA polymerase IV [Nitrososphaerales archaeon]|jgi:DNA polymerase IV (archaeal DinB-like DNA polymerase)